MALKSRIYTFLIMLGIFSNTGELYAITKQSSDKVWNIEHTTATYNTISASKTSFKSDYAAESIQPVLSLSADVNLLKETLGLAPKLEQRYQGTSGILLQLPNPEGHFQTYEVFENQVMSQALARKLPNFKSYKVFSTSGNATGVLDFSRRGFHGMIRNNQGKDYYIDPDFSDASSYPEKYNVFLPNKSNDFVCHTNASKESTATRPTYSRPLQYRQSSSSLKVYRLAIITTGEYAQAVSTGSANTNDTLAAIASAINRINQIYNQDLGIHLELVDDNDQLIFLNGNTDPFTGDTFSDLNKITDTINTEIGSESYDIGHLFTVDGGGIAFLGSVCDVNEKGTGLTGVNASNLQNDFFYIDYVAHEIGHQFGANHTFNADTGSCSGNRNSATAWEPGGGSTVMAYAGICAPQDLQQFSDDYFHAGSIGEILDFTDSSAGNCYSLGNLTSLPNLDTGNVFHIPANTPFFLEASSPDADTSQYTYSWEQMDTGDATSNANEMHQDSGSGPIFRSRPPSSESKRFFPDFEDVIDNTTSFGETYPDSTRSLNFRATLRSNDNGIDYQDTVIQVHKAESAFEIKTPEQNSYQAENGDALIQWNTGASENAPINCSNIDVLYSANNSQLFDNYTTLASNLENDGKAFVTLPTGLSNSARILLKCSNNIFYNINPGTFNIVSNTNAFIYIEALSSAVMEGEAATFRISRTGELSQSSTVNYSVLTQGTNITSSSDFSNNSTLTGTASFNSGETETFLSFETSTDSNIENQESIRVSLNNPGNALLSTSFAETTLIDTSPPPAPTTITVQKNKKSGGSLHIGLLYLLGILTMYRRNLRLTTFAKTFLILGIFTSCTLNQTTYTNEHLQALAKYENASASRDFMQETNKKESPFLAFNLRSKTEIPGLVEDDYQRALQHGFTIQKGMGDFIVNQKHKALREKFYIYASEYNRLLADYLFH